MIYELFTYIYIFYITIGYIIGIITGIFTIYNNPKINKFYIFIFVILSPFIMPVAIYMAYRINKNKNNEVLQ